jgi:hypothetical protein
MKFDGTVSSMRTRWSGDRTHRIVTFTKNFEIELIKAHPQAIRVFISSLLKYLEQNTGRKHTLDYDQNSRIEKYLEQDLVKTKSGYWSAKNEPTLDQHLADTWIQDGIRLSSESLPKALSCLNFLYTRLFLLDV